MNRKIKLIFILYCLRFTLTLHPYFSISIYNIERMRKLFLLTIALCCVMVGLNTGCTDKKPEALADTLAIDTDTIADTTHADTIARIVEETPMPKAADQLFDDFFFNFIANRRLQRARIVFPLPVTRGGKTKMLQKSQWKTEHFFMRQQYYTLIFDNEQQMDNAKSTSLDSVVVEKIYLREGLVDQYAFGHGDGKWRMERINQISFKDNVNASFLNFLQKFFAANGAGMIRNPLPYSGPDPGQGGGGEPRGDDDTSRGVEHLPAHRARQYDLQYSLRPEVWQEPAQDPGLQRTLQRHRDPTGLQAASRQMAPGED